MKILKTDCNNVDDSVIVEAINVMADGGVILYPTDTVYGLGANIFDEKAVRKVFELKRRSLSKPLSVLVRNLEDVNLIAELGDYERSVLDSYLPGPFTFILNKKSLVSSLVTSGLNQVGVRIPDNSLARSLASIFPVITTSANLSGCDVYQSVDDIVGQLDGLVDLVLDVGFLGVNSASTVVDLTSGEWVYIER